MQKFIVSLFAIAGSLGLFAEGLDPSPHLSGANFQDVHFVEGAEFFTRHDDTNGVPSVENPTHTYWITNDEDDFEGTISSYMNGDDKIKYLDFESNITNPVYRTINDCYNADSISGVTSTNIGKGLFMDTRVKFTPYTVTDVHTPPIGLEGTAIPNGCQDKLVVWLREREVESEENGVTVTNMVTNLVATAAYFEGTDNARTIKHYVLVLPNDITYSSLVTDFHRLTIKAFKNITTSEQQLDRQAGFVVYLDGDTHPEPLEYVDADSQATRGGAGIDGSAVSKLTDTIKNRYYTETKKCLLPCLIPGDGQQSISAVGFSGTGAVSEIYFDDYSTGFPEFAMDPFVFDLCWTKGVTGFEFSKDNGSSWETISGLEDAGVTNLSVNPSLEGLKIRNVTYLNDDKYKAGVDVWFDSTGEYYDTDAAGASGVFNLNKQAASYTIAAFERNYAVGEEEFQTLFGKGDKGDKTGAIEYAIANGGWLKLGRDVEINEGEGEGIRQIVINGNETLKLDLAGHTIKGTRPVYPTIQINEGGCLEITNSTATLGAVLDSPMLEEDPGSAIGISSFSAVTIDGGQIETFKFGDDAEEFSIALNAGKFLAVGYLHEGPEEEWVNFYLQDYVSSGSVAIHSSVESDKHYFTVAPGVEATIGKTDAADGIASVVVTQGLDAVTSESDDKYTVASGIAFTVTYKAKNHYLFGNGTDTTNATYNIAAATEFAAPVTHADLVTLTLDYDETKVVPTVKQDGAEKTGESKVYQVLKGVEFEITWTTKGIWVFEDDGSTEKVEKYTLSASEEKSAPAVKEGTFTVKFEDGEHSTITPAAGTSNIVHGTEIAVTATADVNYEFVAESYAGWTKLSDGTLTTNVTVTAAATFKAPDATATPVAISVPDKLPAGVTKLEIYQSSDNGATWTLVVNGKIAVDNKWEVRGTATDGYTVKNPIASGTAELGKAITVNAEQVNSSVTYTVTVPVLVNFTVAVTNGETEVGTTNGVYTFNYASNVKVVFTADTGYEFTKNTSTNIESLVDNVVIDAPTVALKEFTVTFDLAHDSETIVSNSVPYGTAFKDVKPVDPTWAGYTFKNWTPDGEDVVSNTTYTAKWDINSYQIIYTYTPGTGPATPNQATYQISDTDQEFTLNEPKAAAGYHFAGWTVATKDGVSIQDGNTLKILAGTIGNIDVTATYAANVYFPQSDFTEGDIAQGYDQRDGTEAKPFVIRKYEDLVALQEMVAVGQTTAGKCFEQVDDIVFPAVSETTPAWAGIGKALESAPYTQFSGTYDGGNKKITNVTLDGAIEYAALFGQLGVGAVVKNISELNIAGVDNVNEETCVAGLAGYVYGPLTVTDVKVTGTLGTTSSPIQDNVSGLMCALYGSATEPAVFTRLEFAGTINANSASANRKVAGILGYSLGAFTLDQCVVSGTLENNAIVDFTNSKGPQGGVGGFLGYCWSANTPWPAGDPTFKDCVMKGTIVANEMVMPGAGLYGAAIGSTIHFEGTNKIAKSSFGGDVKNFNGNGNSGFVDYAVENAEDASLLDLVNAFEAGKTYYTVKPALTPAYQFTDVGTIAFNTNMYEATAFNVTAGDVSREVTETAAGGVVTFTAALKTFTVTFDAKGQGTAPEAQTVKYGNKATKPEDPTDDDHDFVDWFKDEAGTELFDFDTEITDNITLYAKWKKKTYEVSYTVDGQPAESETVEHGEKPKSIPEIPAKTGYTFTGWSPSDPTNAVITCATNFVTTYAKIPYAITYDYGAGEGPTTSNTATYMISTEAQTIHLTAPKPAAGYAFTGFTLKEAHDGVNFEDKTNMVITAGQINPISVQANYEVIKYTISYLLEGVSGDNLPTYFMVTDNEITVGNVDKEGHTFNGWTCEWLSEPTTDLTFAPCDHLGNVTFTAHFTINKYDVTFNKNIAAETAENVNDWPADTNVTWNTTVNTPAKTPTCEGYRFDGWFKNAECTEAFNFTTTIKKPTTIHAKWVKTFTVTLAAGTGIEAIKVDGVPYTEPRTVDTNTTISVTADVKTGYEPFTPASYTIVCDTNVTLTTTLKTYMVTFKSDDADYAVSNNVPHGTEFAKVKPENPTKTGYTFEGWTPEVTEIDGTELTFTAQWTAEDRTVTFYTNSVPFVVRNVKYDQKIGEIPEMPVITGYSGAWRGTAPDAETIVQEDLEYFYDYTAKPFTFTVSGGANATIMVTTNNATAFAYTEPFQIAFDTTWSVEATPNDKFKFNDGAVTSSNGVVNTEAPVTVTLDDAVPAEITINVTWGATIAAVATNGGNVVAGEVKLPADTTEVAFQLTAAEMTIPVFKVAIGDNGAAVVTNKSPVIQVEDGTKITFSAEEAKAEDPTVTEAQKKDAIIDAIDEGASHDAAVEKVNAIVTTEETPAEGKVKASDLAKWITDQKISSTAIAGSDYIVASVKLDVAPITEATAVKVETVEKQTSDLAVTVKIGETDATKEQIQSFVELCDDLGAANDWEKLPESTLKSAVKIEAGKLVITPQAGISKLFLKVVIPADANVN